jgi:hypothetical protein
VQVPSARSKETLVLETAFDSGPLAGRIVRTADVVIE